MLGGWIPAYISDPASIEQQLKPHEAVLDQIQAILFWGNPVAFAFILIAANSVLFTIRVLNLSYVPTFFFLLALRVLARAASPPGGILRSLFDPSPAGSSPPYGLPEIAGLLARCGRVLFSIVQRLFPSDTVPMRSIALSLGALLALFLALYFIGTFWVSFAAVNLALLLPGVLRKLRTFQSKRL
jgi:hypothetical protein